WESPIRIRKKIGPKAPISGKSYRQKPLDFPHQSAASAYFTVDGCSCVREQFRHDCLGLGMCQPQPRRFFSAFITAI
ncbi:MAG: hypothetical protein WA268_09755, partial [Xanthobacteraceae bacterium]